MMSISNYVLFSMVLASNSDIACRSAIDCQFENKQSNIVLAQLANSQSVDAPATSCDKFAAFPFDPGKKLPGVPYVQLDPVSAISQCQFAVKEFPQTARLYFQLGRALEKGRKLPEAISAYQTAATLGHGGGFNNLGELYRDGKGVSKDIKMAEVYFRKGADLNYPEAQYNLANLLLKNKSSENAVSVARELLSAALKAGYLDARKTLDTLPGHEVKSSSASQSMSATNTTLSNDDIAISNARPDNYEADNTVVNEENQTPLERFKQVAGDLFNQCLRGSPTVGANRVFGVNIPFKNPYSDMHQCAFVIDELGFNQKPIDPEVISNLRTLIKSGMWNGIEVSQGKFLHKYEGYGPTISSLDVLKPYRSNASEEVCLESVKEKGVPRVTAEPDDYAFATTFFCTTRKHLTQFVVLINGKSPQTFRTLTRGEKPCRAFNVNGNSYCESMFYITKKEFSK